MDRDILFRGKRIDNGEWVVGFYAKSGGSFILQDNGLTYGGFEMFEVSSDTVCRYTGLTNKNGRKIFEGDILSAHLDDQYPEDITYIQITWDGFSWCTRESLEDDVMTEHDCNVFEVCGNIFDNPELLEGGAE